MKLHLHIENQSQTLHDDQTQYALDALGAEHDDCIIEGDPDDVYAEFRRLRELLLLHPLADDDPDGVITTDGAPASLRYTAVME